VHWESTLIEFLPWIDRDRGWIVDVKAWADSLLEMPEDDQGASGSKTLLLG
jgi:hypothetical protein